MARPVALFVANLRLLDLDRRDDWPAVSTHTLSARHADQRQRIAAVEWALFRLLELWDPLDTAAKLRPFFPPLEPLQSLNLRAALYRCLNELKKSGVLGRDAVLRKTMLDECKGDRFFELLAVFSAAVLRKVLGQHSTRAPLARTLSTAPLARTLATAPTLSADAQRSLLPLALAHRAALARVLRRKDEKRRAFAHFAAALDAKADAIAARTRRCLDTPTPSMPAVSRRDADALKRQLADHWVGDRKWLALILHGDHAHPADAFLTTRFDTLWHALERGTPLQDAAPAPDAGLLQDLQSRLDDQQARLHTWQTFHAELRRHNATEAPVESKPLLVKREFAFDTHTQHQLPELDAEPRLVQRPALRPSYCEILSDMDVELARVSQSPSQPASRPSYSKQTAQQTVKQSAPQTFKQSFKQTNRQTSKQSAPQTFKRTALQASEDTTQQTFKQTAGQTAPQTAWHADPTSLSHPPLSHPTLSEPKTLLSEPKTLLSEPKTLVRDQKALFEGLAAAASHPHLHRRPSGKPTPIHSDPPRLARAASSSPLLSEDSAPSQPTPSSEPSPSPSPSPPFSRSIPTLNPDLLADQIISAIGNATPSPVKKPQPRMSMSLVDRTRMTLSRTPSFDPVPESPDTLPAAPPADLTRETLPNQALLERTRQSMAALSRASSVKQRPAKQTKDREAAFPINQFDTFPVTQIDTPRADTTSHLPDQGGSGTKTPREHLLDADVDYDRVFKSRPRIATSPIFSPHKYHDENAYGEDAYDDDVTGIDLGDVDMSDADDDGFTQTLDASPSRRRGGY